MIARIVRALGASLVATALIACSGPSGAGAIVFAASGEEAAVEGYPTSTGIAFVDGWTLQFDHVYVSLDQVRLRSGGTETSVEDGPILVDLHDGDQELFRFEAIPARRYDDVGYRLLPPTSSTTLVGRVDASDAAQMVSRRYGIWLVGTAMHPAHGTFALDLGVPVDVTQSHCVNGTDGTDGVVVPVSGVAEAVLTFHLDHFFFDSIIAEEPAVRFEAYAAAAGADGVITLDDLATQPLADLVGVGGAPLVDEAGDLVAYDPGSAPLARQDLRSFVVHQATTIGHFDGEGHCAYTVTPVP